MNEIAVKQAQEFHAPIEASLLGVISRAASDPNCDVSKMRELLAMHKELAAHDAAQEANKAMANAQAEIGRIAADMSNPQTKSKYASYAALDRVLRPIYTKHGFALSFDTGDAPENVVRVLAYLAHSGGHSRTFKVDMPADGKGAKGGDVMTKTHAVGAAMSYGSRYLLKLIFNVAVGEDDDDGNGAGGDTINADQLQKVRDLIERSGSEIDKFCAYFKIGALPDLKAKDYPRAIEALNLKERKKP